MRIRTACIALLLTGSVTGCGTKLDQEATFDLTDEFSRSFIVEPIKSEQKIKVTGKATEGAVDVFIFLERNKDGAQREIYSKRSQDFILARKEKTDAIDLEATIPANERAVIQLNRVGTKAAKGQIKITNK